jgi:GT2 family glycosyltransferase
MPATGSIDLSIVIVSYNTSRLLDECLASIERAGRKPAIEIIVVDNASSDDSCEMVSSKWPLITLIQNSANNGFARANNQALQMCRGRYAILLNSDTQVRPGALESMVAFLDEHREVGIAGPRLLNTDGTLQPSGNRIPSAFSQIWWTLPFHRISGRQSWRMRYLDDHRDYNQIADVDEVSGAALMMRREVWETIGFLDEGYFFYFEDVDFCIRARSAGWRVVYFPRSEIVHHWGMSSKRAGLSIHPRALVSHFRYMRKVHGRPAELTLRLVVAAKACLKLGMLALDRKRQPDDRQLRIQTNLHMLRISLGQQATA